MPKRSPSEIKIDIDNFIRSGLSAKIQPENHNKIHTDILDSMHHKDYRVLEFGNGEGNPGIVAKQNETTPNFIDELSVSSPATQGQIRYNKDEVKWQFAVVGDESWTDFANPISLFNFQNTGVDIVGVVSTLNFLSTIDATLNTNVLEIKVADASLTNTQISPTAAIEVSKIEQLTANQVVITDSNGVLATDTIANIIEGGSFGFISSGDIAGGDLTGEYPDPTVNVNVIDNNKLSDMNINTVKIGPDFSGIDPLTSGNPQDKLIGENSLLLRQGISDLNSFESDPDTVIGRTNGGLGNVPLIQKYDASAIPSSVSNFEYNDSNDRGVKSYDEALIYEWINVSEPAMYQRDYLIHEYSTDADLDLESEVTGLNQKYIIVSGISATRTITLPTTAVPTNKTYWIRNSDDVSDLSVNSETVSVGQTIIVMYDGSNWKTLLLA